MLSSCTPRACSPDATGGDLVVVQKFGGTSVEDPDAIQRAVGIVAAARARGERPTVVVSAMAGVTDALLTMAETAGGGDGAGALVQLDALRQRHEAAVQALALDDRAVVTHVDEVFRDLSAIVTALAVLRDVSPQTVDVIVGSGELLSSRLVTAALMAVGEPGEWVDARQVIITDAEFTCAAPLQDETRAAICTVVAPLLEGDRIPVLGGFVGATTDGRFTTLGRGGSDYSAAILAAGLGASEIQIWTDVDGMQTADPRVVTAPRRVPRLSFGEAAELAYFGAKVLHPATIAPAVEHDIPVRILNSRAPDGEGTRITADACRAPGQFAALAFKRDVTVVDITSTRMLDAYGFLRRVFEVFERYRTVVDVVTTSEVSVSVTVEDPRRLDAIAAALGDLAQVSVEPGMALLSAVGDGLRTEPTATTRVVRILDGVPLRMISQAASRRNITVVLRQTDLAGAVHRLHEELFA
jgi:aspartate kinase